MSIIKSLSSPLPIFRPRQGASASGGRETNPDMNQKWEELCRRCGRCCYEKIEFEGDIYYTDDPCEHLDPATRLCRIYPDRCRLRPGCVALTPQLVRQGLLPDDCPYVAFVLSGSDAG